MIKLLLATPLLGAVAWEALGEKVILIGGVVATLIYLGHQVRKITRPVVRTVENASHAYQSMLNLDGRLDERDRRVDEQLRAIRSSTESAASGLEARLTTVEGAIEDLRQAVGTRADDHPLPSRRDDDALGSG